jgi:hypothetical protein
MAGDRHCVLPAREDDTGIVDFCVSAGCIWASHFLLIVVHGCCPWFRALVRSVVSISGPLGNLNLANPTFR